MDRFDDAQRREAREFALLHPDRATVSGVEESNLEPKAQESLISRIKAHRDQELKQEMDPGMKEYLGGPGK
ncbi:MAG: hypothetical protein HY922_11800 [Elusimicrobia bacterium]|nr:hypothetical protein [Elusimicrobiota bacterium]